MRTAKTLIRLGGSEFSLGAQFILLACHVAAHIYSRTNDCRVFFVKKQYNVSSVTCMMFIC